LADHDAIPQGFWLLRRVAGPRWSAGMTADPFLALQL
jgi:hypothetical protein